MMFDFDIAELEKRLMEMYPGREFILSTQARYKSKLIALRVEPPDDGSAEARDVQAWGEDWEAAEKMLFTILNNKSKEQ